MWKDILKAGKINWKEFKRSLPTGTNLGSLNERGRGANLDVIFPSEEIMMAWVIEYGQEFDVDWQEGGRTDFHILSIPRIRFDEYDTKSRLRAKIEDEDETYEFEDFENP